jgi:thymidylate synthase (FAD)
MKKENVLGDNIGFIELVDSLGNDLTIVNSARVSFGARSDWVYEERDVYDESTREIHTHREPVGLKDKDKKLIKYLAKNKHFSPFRHIQLQFHVKMPEMIARQMFKHIVGADYTFKDTAWNEISGRYAVMNDEFYRPNIFRLQSKDNKQASEGQLGENHAEAYRLYNESLDTIYAAYRQLLELGVAKEQARGLLPVSFYTEFFWTASLQAVVNFIQLRLHEHAQYEIQKYAAAMKELTMEVAPEGLTALLNGG